MASWEGLALAVSFLTILPAPPVTYRPEGLGQAARWFSLVGLLVGVLLAGVHWLGLIFFPPWLTAALTVTGWAVLTGGLHLDGVADCCDGLLAPTTPARRLEIMRDPRAGAFAVSGVALILLLKTAALAALPNPTLPLLFAPTIARWLLLWVAQSPLARPGGLGAALRDQLGTSTLLWGALPVGLMLLTGLGLADWGVRLLIAALLAGGMCWLLVRLALGRIGGVTGDLFGCAVEVSEVVVLIACVAGNWK